MAAVFNQDLTCSDHAAIWVALDGVTLHNHSHKKKIFHFDAAWCSSPECAEVIQQAWSPIMEAGSSESVFEKIQATRVSLLRWNSMSFGNIRRKIEGFVGGMVREGGDNESHILKDIKRIKDETGAEIIDKDDIHKVILKYFGSIFESTCPTVEAMEVAIGCIKQRVTTAMNEALSQPFTSEEITLALKQMHPLKSPGPDDMSSILYQKYWSIVGSEVCNLILNFLNNGSLNPLINFTDIVLIPKCPNPLDMNQFCLTSLCNVIYKMASKVIANRIKPFLGVLVSNSQSFVPGRLIMDNVLLAYELNHFLK
ncbi:UNVERIFIED_CONTAM: hypothetical protein Slati_0879400 [Sesamum latifolium]|uniref:Reverse transcriptase domain-containing protein n=1 Tax=Sesamum latifolium TaxID=2727402 RepID=A0AAW2XR39_9LAMI